MKNNQRHFFQCRMMHGKKMKNPKNTLVKTKFAF